MIKWIQIRDITKFSSFSTFWNYCLVSISVTSQIVRRDLWPLRHLIRVMRRNEPGVYGGLNASRVGLYGGSNAQKCMMAAVLCKKYTALYLQFEFRIVVRCLVLFNPSLRYTLFCSWTLGWHHVAPPIDQFTIHNNIKHNKGRLKQERCFFKHFAKKLIAACFGNTENPEKIQSLPSMVPSLAEAKSEEIAKMCLHFVHSLLSPLRNIT